MDKVFFNQLFKQWKANKISLQEMAKALRVSEDKVYQAIKRKCSNENRNNFAAGIIKGLNTGK